MIKRLLLFALFLVGLGFSTVSAQSVLKLDKKTHDFGNVMRSKPVTCVFAVTNTGDKPLIINQVVPSCGCTVAIYTKEPIKPGGTGQIQLTYDGKNQFEGRFSRVASVYSNASNKLERIRVQGVLVEDEKDKSEN